MSMPESAVFDIQGLVADVSTGKPILGATVQVSPTIAPNLGQTLVTDAQGIYHYHIGVFTFWGDGMNLVTSCFFGFRVSASGYIGQGLQKFIVAQYPGEPGTTINFRLERLQVPAPPAIPPQAKTVGIIALAALAIIGLAIVIKRK